MVYFIKDSDGFYRCDVEERNQVAYFDLNDMDDINARTKSYVDLDVNDVVTNIVEKKVISSTFSSGGYGLQMRKSSAKTFRKNYRTWTENATSVILYLR